MQLDGSTEIRSRARSVTSPRKPQFPTQLRGLRKKFV